jgi:hypothetical protein
MSTGRPSVRKKKDSAEMAMAKATGTFSAKSSISRMEGSATVTP